VFEVFTSLVQQKIGERVGRRLFHRAPAHHAMTHKGIPEPKVVVRFWSVSLILASIALLSLKIR
jgi:phospho-N-acetylmuramoyl-pentapeptide-transferase